MEEIEESITSSSTCTTCFFSLAEEGWTKLQICQVIAGYMKDALSKQPHHEWPIYSHCP